MNLNFSQKNRKMKRKNTKLKVAILGLGSIGEFHAREFHNSGCEVSAILTTSKKSAKEASKKLKDLYGIKARYYFNLEELLSKEKLDAVSICTPSEMHSIQTKQSLDSGLHVLCEKPFVLDSKCNNYKTAKKLVKLAKEKKRILSVNTQWVSLLDELIKNHELQKISNFSMYLEPNIEGAINLISEAVPHMNSFLIKLLGDKEVKNIKFPLIQKDSVKIQFEYGICQVEYNFGLKKERPRKINFSINEIKFERIIGKNYQQQIAYDGKVLDINDPLKVSIQKFVNAIKNKDKPLIEKSEIIQNVKLQDLIIKKYLSVISQ